MKKIMMAIAVGICTTICATQVAFAGDLTDRIVILDAGHGDNYNVYAGYDEGKRMLELAELVKPLLEAEGATVYMTRTTSDNLELATRSAYANILSLEFLLELKEEEAAEEEIAEIKNLLEILYLVKDEPEIFAPIYTNTPYDYSGQTDIHPKLQRVFELQNNEEIGNHFLFLSLHTNATPFPINNGAYGVEAYYIDTQKPYYQGYSYADASYYFADMILTDLQALGFAKLKVIEDDMHVNREMNLPSVLVENGFHTNANDRAKLQDDAILERMSVIYKDAVVKYFQSSFISDVIPVEKKAVDAFFDVTADKWYYEGVDFVTDLGILSGVSQNEFAPTSNVNGGMMFSALERMMEMEVAPIYGTNTEFLASLNKNAWYYNAFVWATQYGLLEGIAFQLDENGVPSQSLTRAETAQIFHGYLTLVLEDLPEVATEEIAFVDGNEIPAAYQEAVCFMESMGIMMGNANGSFNPNGNVTRAEFANILYRIYPLVVVEDVEEAEEIEEIE